MSKSDGVRHGSRDNIGPIKIELRIALEERTTFDVSDLFLSLLETAWIEL